MSQKKKVIGLLGGIGAGKSTVAGCFARLGCAVIDADRLAHKALDEQDIKDSVLELFGGDVFDAEGNMDKSALGRKVFSDKEELEKLTRLIHPRVMAEVEQLIMFYQAEKEISAIVLDVPLLAEVERLDLCDVLVFVEADEAIRQKRAQKNGKFNENELKKRENLQISLDTKRQIADYIVRNNSDNSDVAEQVAQLFSSITGSRQV